MNPYSPEKRTDDSNLVSEQDPEYHFLILAELNAELDVRDKKNGREHITRAFHANHIMDTLLSCFCHASMRLLKYLETAKNVLQHHFQTC